MREFIGAVQGADLFVIRDKVNGALKEETSSAGSATLGDTS